MHRIATFYKISALLRNAFPTSANSYEFSGSRPVQSDALLGAYAYAYAPASVGSLAESQPLIPADITFTSV
jgi:hypothetical protein